MSPPDVDERQVPSRYLTRPDIHLTRNLTRYWLSVDVDLTCFDVTPPDLTDAAPSLEGRVSVRCGHHRYKTMAPAGPMPRTSLRLRAFGLGSAERPLALRPRSGRRRFAAYVLPGRVRSFVVVSLPALEVAVLPVGLTGQVMTEPERATGGFFLCSLDRR